MRGHPPNKDRSLAERLVKKARLARAKAEQTEPGPEREELLKDASEAEVAADINQWLTSKGLRPPE
jgi:hypothetical protein